MLDPATAIVCSVHSLLIRGEPRQGKGNGWHR